MISSEFLCAECGLFMTMESSQVYIAQFDKKSRIPPPRRILECKMFTCPNCSNSMFTDFKNCKYDSPHPEMRRRGYRALESEAKNNKNILLFTTHEKVRELVE